MGHYAKQAASQTKISWKGHIVSGERTFYFSRVNLGKKGSK